MDFKKQRPTYRRASGEGRVTAPGNHSSQAAPRPTAARSERQAASSPRGSKLFSQREKAPAATPKPVRKERPAAPKHTHKAAKVQRMFMPAAAELAERVGALDDVARASASYSTAPGTAERVTARGSIDAAEHALEDSRRRRTRIARMAIAVVTVCVLAAIAVSVFALRKDAVMDIQGSAYTHIIGQRVDLPEPVEVERQDESWVAVSSSSSFTMDGRPLYLEQTGDALFGDGAMVVLPARQGSIRNIPARTRASYSGGIGALTSHEGKAEPIESGFLYDGSDTYTLLSDATLITSAGEVALPALSSVEAVYGGAVYVYDHGADSMQVFDAGTARLLVDDGYMAYEVDLLADTLTIDGESQLLLGSAASMPSIFE